MSAVARTTDSGRRALLAKVHLAKKDLALTDDSYRDRLQQVTGHRSAADCSEPQLVAVIEAFKALGWKDKPARRVGARPLADSPQARKARAQWLSLWNLGVIDDAGERALAAFVTRQTGREDLRFCDATQLNKVVDGLKAMLARAFDQADAPSRRFGHVDDERLNDRVEVVRAQWATLYRWRVVRIPDDSAIAGWGQSRVAQNFSGPNQWTREELDDAIARLGQWLRRAKAQRPVND